MSYMFILGEEEHVFMVFNDSFLFRKNRTLIDSVVAMLTHSGLSLSFAEAIHTAVYLQNRSPSKALPDDRSRICAT
ncbi:hypothetical protein MPTK1_6g07870 [Marchantia polymorpha subsp. ruderalis]